MPDRIETAEDCTEDVFVKVLTGTFRFQGKEHEERWLAVTSMNLCKDRLRHWWRKRVCSVAEYEELPDEHSNQSGELLAVVQQLPNKYKDVIYLYYYKDYKTEEIAKILNKPPSTVRNHLRGARARLRLEVER